MGFQPTAGAGILINGVRHVIGEHPQAAGIPYGQEGRQATVYLLQEEQTGKKQALKVFRPRFVKPSLVHTNRQIVKFSGMKGLAVCERFVLHPDDHADLLQREPGLLYAVVMPWVEGPTWTDLLLDERRLTRRESYTAAYALAEILLGMEQRGVAHCDLSGPNVMLPLFRQDKAPMKSSDYVQLIDLEQMHGPQLEQPEDLPGGSPGYAPRNIPKKGFWSRDADRFSGAILLAEMLLASAEDWPTLAWGESFFDPHEVQTLCDRHDYAQRTLRNLWGPELADKFKQAWESEDLSRCPTFAEWIMALNKIDLLAPSPLEVAASITPSWADAEAESGTEAEPSSVKPNSVGSQVANYGKWLAKAKTYEQQSKFKKALDIYRKLQQEQLHASLAREIEIAIRQVEQLEQEEARQVFRASLSFGLKKMAKWIVTLAVVAAIGGSIYYTVLYFKGMMNKEAAPTKEEMQQLQDALVQKEEELGMKDKEIEDLKNRIAFLLKPAEEREQDLVYQLDRIYVQMRDYADSDRWVGDLEADTFEAAASYVEHFFQYLEYGNGFDERFLAQLDTVLGYYFPYLYNRNRNAQLNLQFYESYRERFSSDNAFVH